MCPGLLRSGRLASRCWSGLSLALLLGPRARQVAADLPLQRRYVPLSRWLPGVRRAACCLPALLPLLRDLFIFFAAGSAPAAARAAPPSPFIAAPVCPVSDCVFAAAAAVAVCPVCSSSSRCRFFAAGVDAAPAVSLLAAAPVLLLLKSYK